MIKDILKLVAAFIIVGMACIAACASYRTLYNRCVQSTVVVVNPKYKRIGTGVMLDSRHVLTVRHMIVKSSDTMVVLAYPDSLSSTAKVLSGDDQVDLAILTLDHAIADTQAASIAKSNAHVGDDVLIIGSGMGLAWSASAGIVSGINRLHEKFAQTDAVINHGNSGGPVFDMHGKVIGIVDAKLGGEDTEGVGFFVPVDQIRKFIGLSTLGDDE